MAASSEGISISGERIPHLPARTTGFQGQMALHQVVIGPPIRHLAIVETFLEQIKDFRQVGNYSGPHFILGVKDPS
jgi:hypothetical protein